MLSKAREVFPHPILPNLEARKGKLEEFERVCVYGREKMKIERESYCVRYMRKETKGKKNKE